MLSSQKHILELVALLKSHQVYDIVLSPGSRNAALIQTFSQESSFRCHLVVDERNAAFYALGIIQASQKPVAICCTSGTALLNYAPAVAEAHYQELPLIVISADRPQAWIGQMDGQTIAQYNVFGSLVNKSIHLNEIHSKEEHWHCNRQINEALIASLYPRPCPVHINIAISEPLFDYTVKKLPELRTINFAKADKQFTLTTEINDSFIQSQKRMILIGQMHKTSNALRQILTDLEQNLNCVILCEHLSNTYNDSTITNFDPVLYSLTDAEQTEYSPDLLITLGGHIASKRLKQFLRENKPKEHWHISHSGEWADLYQCLTMVIEANPISFLAEIAKSKTSQDCDKGYKKLWQSKSSVISEPALDKLSDISAVGSFILALPKNSALHLANSSALRHAQLFKLDQSIEVFCNRGTNGIESSLPSAIGFSSVHDKPVYLIIGDLSFFYTVGALWNIEHIKNLRILLLNNNSGGIFHTIPVLNRSASVDKYVAAQHHTNAKDWAYAAKLNYLSASSQTELNTALKDFTTDKTEQSIILEVKLDLEDCKSAIKEYYHQFKQCKK